MATKTPAKAAAPAAPIELWIELPYGQLGLARRMRVVAPDFNQIAVWQANGERFSALATEWGDADRVLSGLDRDDPRAVQLRDRKNTQAAKALGRAMRVLNSLLQDQTDRDWLEDQLMDGEMTLEADATKVMSLTIEAARAYKREEAPATGPATKAKLSA